MKNLRTPIVDPNRHDWNFDGLPCDQLLDCLWYEYARESPTIIDDVKTWRKWRRLSSTARNEHRVFPGREFVLSGRLRILTLCPEFPEKPWREIPNGDRVKRIKQYRLEFLPALEEHFNREQQAFKVLDPFEDQQRLLAMVPRAKIRKDWPHFDQKVHGRGEDIFCEINWQRCGEEIIRSFSRWVWSVKRQQPKRRKCCNDDASSLLKALGALRLLRHFRKFEQVQARAIEMAIDHTRNPKDKPLFATRESWLKAVGRAKKYLARIVSAEAN